MTLLDDRVRVAVVHPWPPPPSPADRRRALLRRRAVPAIAIALVAVFAADVMVLDEVARRESAVQIEATRRLADARAGGLADRRADQGAGRATDRGFVAAAEGLPPTAEVRPLTRLRRPHLFVVARHPLDAATVDRVGKVAGVRGVERADAAAVVLDGKKVHTLGVDPSTFRAYTPEPTARSDALWAGVAAGEVAVSFVLGNDGGLTLGRHVTSGTRTIRVGAYATMGMGSIDAVVSRTTARALGLPEDNALVISAPEADTAKLRRKLLRLLPKGTQVATINPVLTRPRQQTGTGTAPQAGPQSGTQTGTQTGTVWPASALMSAAQLQTALTAAAGKIGRPYVWGAEGPDTFDCSGLVQWAYAQAGVRVPRVTHQQFVAGPQVPLAEAQPGDLLFWRHDPTNPGYVSHVAIYWGDGKMLHAPRTGDVVKISPVTTRNLAGVVRVSPQVAQRVR